MNKNKQNIKPHNENGEAHGYWELYHPNGTLHFKGTFVNGIPCGWCESYYISGDPAYKCVYDNNVEIGYEEYDGKMFHLI